MKRYSSFIAGLLFSFVPHPALAQSTTACTQAEANGFGGVTAQTSNVFQQFANWVMAGPVKYGFIVAIAVLIFALLMDNGQLPQMAKTVIGVLAGILLVVLVISWILNQNLCVGS